MNTTETPTVSLADKFRQLQQAETKERRRALDEEAKIAETLAVKIAENDQAFLELHEAGRMKQTDMAAELGVEQGEVATRIARARKANGHTPKKRPKDVTHGKLSDKTAVAK